MRKIFAIVLVLALATGFACAEEAPKVFEFRNGIRFGDSMEAVMEKETFPIYRYDRDILKVSDVTLSGFPSSDIRYEFEPNGGLCQVFYTYNDVRHANRVTKEEYTEMFRMIEDGLTRKYGEGEEIFLPDPPEEFKNRTTNNLFRTERTLSFETYEIKIEHYMNEYHSGFDYYCKHHLCYTYSDKYENPNDLVDNDL